MKRKLFIEIILCMMFFIFVMVNLVNAQVNMYPPAYWLYYSDGTTGVGSWNGLEITYPGYPNGPEDVLEYMNYNYGSSVVSQAAPQLAFQMQDRAGYDWHLWAWKNIEGYSEYIIETQDYPFLTPRDPTPWYTQPNSYFASLFPSYPFFGGYTGYNFPLLGSGGGLIGLMRFNYYPFTVQQNLNNLILLSQYGLVRTYFCPSTQTVFTVW